MKRITFIATPFFAGLLVMFSQLGCQRPTGVNRSVSVPPAPNTNSSKEMVDSAAIERELLRIETDWPRVLKEKDAEAVRRVEADDTVIVYPDGSLGTKEQDVKDMESGAMSADSWEVVDTKVTVINNDAAVVSGRSIVKGGKVKGPNGRTLDISGEYRWVDTFARRSGQWKLVATIGTPVRQPRGLPSPAASKTPKMTEVPEIKASPPPKPTGAN